MTDHKIPRTGNLPSQNQWTPPTQRDNCLDIYIKAVQKNVLEPYNSQKGFRRNLSGKETAAIKKLASQTDIVIKPADKGDAIVVMNTSDYGAEAEKQFAERSFYRVVDSDLLAEFEIILEETLYSLNLGK